jgi:hypothetical protein
MIVDLLTRAKPKICILQQVASFKSSLLLKIELQNTQTLQLN